MRISAQRRWRVPGTRLALLVALVVTLLLVVAARALAGSGNFATDHYLASGAGTYDTQYHSLFYETESWNSDEEGIGNCAGLDNSSGMWEHYNCHSDVGDGYPNDTYCDSTCVADAGYSGYAAMSDNSAYGSDFTGWEDFQ